MTKPLPGRKSVVVAFIHPGQTSAYFTTSMLAMMLYDQNTRGYVGGLVNEWSSANVSAARNSLVSKFLAEYTADWLMFIDADMAWEHDALERLMQVASPERAPVLGGLCFGASGGELFSTIYQLAEIDGKPMTVRVNDFEPDSIVQCAATGAAFVLIHRSVLVAMRDKGFNSAFPWFQETQIGDRPCGEDITFCLRAGQLGFPVHVHTGVEIGHHKSHLLTNDLFKAQREAECATTTA
jgi:GT2 family glycosyltransferase